MIPTCPALQDGTSPETALLSLNTSAGERVREPEIGQLKFVYPVSCCQGNEPLLMSGAQFAPNPEDKLRQGQNISALLASAGKRFVRTRFVQLLPS